MASLQDDIRDLQRAIKDLTTATKGSGRGGGGGGVTGGSGGSSPSLAERARSAIGGGGGLSKGNLLAQAGVAAAQFTGAGLVNASRGGTFSGGFATSALQTADSVLPSFVSKGLGIAQTNEVLGNAKQTANSLTNQIARYGGANAIGGDVRKFVAGLSVQQERNVQEDKRRNSAAVNDQLPAAAQGQGAGGIGGDAIAAITRLAQAIEGGGIGAPKAGGGRHT